MQPLINWDWWIYKSGEWTASLIWWLSGRAGDALPTGRPIDHMRTSSLERKEMRNLQNLTKKLATYEGQAEERRVSFYDLVEQRIYPHVPDVIPTFMKQPVRKLCEEILKDEGYFSIQENSHNGDVSLSQIWDRTKEVRRQLSMYEQPDHSQAIEKSLVLFLWNMLSPEVLKVPTGEGTGMSGFSVPLYTMYKDIGEVINSIIAVVFQKPEDDGTLSRLGKKFEYNLAVVSGIDPDKINQSDKMPVFPHELRNKSAFELINMYLAGTPFVDFLKTSVPFDIPHDRRFEHMHVVAGSGHGKTQLLQSFILSDLERVKNGEGSLIVIDSQGDMINKIWNMELLGDMPERVVYIDPTDIAHPPALNLFDFGEERYKNYNPLEQEILINGAIALYEYVFGALLGAELTQRQGVIFRYLARLMMEVPDATIHTLIDFMQNPDETRPYISKLDYTAAQFFTTHFFSKSFDSTREQILTRLYGVLSTSALERMFTNKRNKVNLYEAMNSGSLILINTSKELLKQEGCEILGRFFIALICQAAQERASIPEGMRTDTFVYIDEAQDYFDKNIENLLSQVRKYNVGIVLSHQNLAQFDHRLREAVNANTSIKMAGGLSGGDARAHAQEMNCDAGFLQSIRKHTTYTEFACLVKNELERPVRIKVDFGQLEAMPKNPDEGLKHLRELNRVRYCTNIQNFGRFNPDDDPPDENQGFTLDDPELL